MSVTQTTPERRLNLSGFLPIINRWKYLVLGLTLAAAVISSIVSLLKPNIYKSTSVFYPTNLQTVDPDRIFEGQKIEVSGSTEDIDRIITIGNSQPLAEYVINKYQLNKDYDVADMKDDAEKEYVYRKFSSDLDILHNERDAIELTFFSEDKIKAAAVANDIVNRIDYMNQQLTLENRKKVLTIYQHRFDFIANEFNTVRHDLDLNRKKYGIFGLDRESRYLGKSIIETQTDLVEAKGELEFLQQNGQAGDSKTIALQAKVNGLQKAFNALTATNKGNLHNLESYSAGVDIVNELYSRYTDLQGRYIGAKNALQNAELALKGQISSVYVVQKAYPATKKAKPIRWLIVGSSTLLTFILAIVFVALFELYKQETRRIAL